jgi:hypothetical protein
MEPENRIDAATKYAAELVRLHGDRRAARMLGISPESLARLLAGLAVHNGTVALVIEHERASAFVRSPSQRPARVG